MNSGKKTSAATSPRDSYRPDLYYGHSIRCALTNLSRFALEDGLQFMSLAAQALCQDEFSKCFEPKPVRHNPSLSLRSIIYMIGVGIRYGILFPIRLSILCFASFLFCCALPFVIGDQKAGQRLFYWFCKVWLLSISAWVRHHGVKPSPQGPHIFVANHTSFIDFFLLSSHEFCHATVAQIHGGLFGFLQRHVLSLNGSLFFYRDESKDREKLSLRMKAHTQKWQSQSPLIIFPEGTCVNNEYTVLFHKGAFELGCAVCPAAIKYNKRLLDPYWNTREQSFAQHLFYLMTRWFMIADVWWLPPVRIKQDESSIDFSNRVKDQISKAAGLKNLSWNGYMKNFVRLQDQEKLQKTTQMKYGAVLRKKLPKLIGAEVVQLETGKLDQAKEAEEREILSSSVNIRPTALRRKSVIEDTFDLPIEGTLTDLRNQILVSTPPKSPSHLRTSVTSEPVQGKLAQSWKHHSTVMKLYEADNVGVSKESRLDNASWRLWSKHNQDRKRSGEKGATISDVNEEDALLESSINMGIDIDQ